jgi:magnesium chelatase subunit I
MLKNHPTTFGELKRQVNRLPGVREEMRANLILKLKNKEPIFPDIIGYDDTVIPGLVNALVCGHNMIILGERGQGKSRIIRNMTAFLDDEMPAIDGCPIHDNPFAPICTECRAKAAELGDDLPIAYIPKDRRLVEKLATSDVSTADLIGEIDPIKIARGKTLDDESAIHFGLVPRAHRSIFAINELPDLAEKIQVAFFNIMEESDFQIKGFPVRLPLDIFIIATANPEDYTNRGRIITPLKDRFDVQLRTHYPKEREHEIRIMEQEIEKPDIDGISVQVPDFIKEILVEITFQARKSTDINQHSGVSCRVSIRSLEAIIGNALKRCLTVGEPLAVPRITDIDAVFPAISGKIELEYELPDNTGESILETLAKRAVKIVFDRHFKIEDMASLIDSFQNGMSAEISTDQPSEDYMDGYHVIEGLKDAVHQIVEPDNPALAASAIEFVLEGLHLSNKLNRDVLQKGVRYR